jgi:RES domain-containing protein
VKTLWRISNHADLIGLGGEKTDGRWHTAAKGKRVVYLSESPSLALIEVLANLRGDPRLFPDRYQLIEVKVVDRVWELRRKITERSLKSAHGDITVTRRRGDSWLMGLTSALMTVPSIPAPKSTNVLFNPLHRDAQGVSIGKKEWIFYDKRLFHLGTP